MINSTIFLVSWPVTSWDAERYGFEYLEKRGFKVYVYDISLLINKSALAGQTIHNEIRSRFVHKISSFKEFREKIKRAAPESVFIDYLMGLSDIDLKHEKIFRILKNCGARYFVISAGALPIPPNPGSKSALIKKVLEKVRHARNIGDLFGFLLKKIIWFNAKNGWIYPKPERIFGLPSVVLHNYIHRYRYDRKRVIPVHSFDYVTHISYQREKRNHVKTEGPTCVFMDEGITDHPDFEILKRNRIDKAKYYKSMNRLFDAIERQTGLKVVIAGHPRLNYDNTSNPFEGRKIFQHNSIDLVAKSDLVVMHTTTSVSFAVLFNKPILSVKTNDMIEKGHGKSVDAIAESLGIEAMNIDDDPALDSITPGLFDIAKVNYEDYKHRYVKIKDLEDRTVWEIVADEINNMNTIIDDSSPKNNIVNFN